MTFQQNKCTVRSALNTLLLLNSTAVRIIILIWRWFFMNPLHVLTAVFGRLLAISTLLAVASLDTVRVLSEAIDCANFVYNCLSGWEFANERVGQSWSFAEAATVRLRVHIWTTMCRKGQVAEIWHHGHRGNCRARHCREGCCILERCMLQPDLCIDKIEFTVLLARWLIFVTRIWRRCLLNKKRFLLPQLLTRLLRLDGAIVARALGIPVN